MLFGATWHAVTGIDLLMHACMHIRACDDVRADTVVDHKAVVTCTYFPH